MLALPPHCALTVRALRRCLRPPGGDDWFGLSPERRLPRIAARITPAIVAPPPLVSLDTAAYYCVRSVDATSGCGTFTGSLAWYVLMRRSPSDYGTRRA